MNIEYHRVGLDSLRIIVKDTSLQECFSLFNQLRESLQKDTFFQNFELISGYGDLLLTTREWAGISWEAVKQKLQVFIENCSKNLEVEGGKLVEIPVCYDEEFALDWKVLEDEIKIPFEKIIQQHTEPTYFVHFIGFTVGFPFLSGLSKDLFLPRKATPRISIPKGSVAIAGEQAGIYSVESAGGWHILGRTPSSLFDLKSEEITLLKAGDRVRFYPISKKEFSSLL